MHKTLYDSTCSLCVGIVHAYLRPLIYIGKSQSQRLRDEFYYSNFPLQTLLKAKLTHVVPRVLRMNNRKPS